MDGQRLKIIHCFRSPVGGIFRHVRDLIEAQTRAGHEVGILCDRITGGVFEEALIAEIAPKLALGVHRVTMRRAIGPSDLSDLHRTYRLLGAVGPDILHGHGAKGGAYARIVGTALSRPGRPVARLYTPHGGSMHYDPRTLGGRLFFRLERLLERMSDHLLFVSQYEEAAYREKVGVPEVASRVVYNGLSPAEFEPVAPAPDASDFLYLGMLRPLKGPDILIEALGEIHRRTGSVATATFVGAGEQKPELERMAASLPPGAVRFCDPMPARRAFALGRMLVLPSRADSLPYVVLEALAAGLPVTAVDVGGVKEIVPSAIQPLVRPEDPVALAQALDARRRSGFTATPGLAEHVRGRFVVSRMVGDTMDAYRLAVAERTLGAERAGAGAMAVRRPPARPRVLAHPKES